MARIGSGEMAGRNTFADVLRTCLVSRYPSGSMRSQNSPGAIPVVVLFGRELSISFRTKREDTHEHLLGSPSANLARALSQARPPTLPPSRFLIFQWDR
jgi:hypothetical protein